MQNCLFQQDLQILSEIVSDKMYIFHFYLKKNTIKVLKFHSSNKISDIQKKR